MMFGPCCSKSENLSLYYCKFQNFHFKFVVQFITYISRILIHDGTSRNLAHKNFPLYIVSFVVLSAGNCCERKNIKDLEIIVLTSL